MMALPWKGSPKITYSSLPLIHWYSCSFSNLFVVHSFSPQILIEHLLCAKHWSRLCDHLWHSPIMAPLSSGNHQILLAVESKFMLLSVPPALTLVQASIFFHLGHCINPWSLLLPSILPSFQCAYMVMLLLSLKLSLGDFPGGTVVKNLPANAGDMGSIPSPGRSHMLGSN